MHYLKSLRVRVALVWLVFLLVVAFSLIQGSRVRANIVAEENARFEREAVLASVASEVFTAQLVHQVGALLRAVRQFHRKSGTYAETEAFIDQLGFDRSLIDGIYLLDAEGWGVAKARGRNAADRDYFQHHRQTSGDSLKISPVEVGRVSGKLHFRISIRVERDDGRFDGVVLATVRPEAFSNHYRQMQGGENRVFSLILSDSHRLLTRLPEPTPEQWARPADDDNWTRILSDEVGRFVAVSPVDGIERVYVFRKIHQLPLVMFIGFAEADVQRSVAVRFGRLQDIAVSGLIILGLAALLLSVTLLSRERLALANERLAHAYDAMRAQAMTDALTGLPARPMFFDRLAQAVSAARRNERLVALLFLDLDGFKAVNDRFGHDAGDVVLKAVTHRWLACVRESDTVARLGGDEFAVIIADVDPGTSLQPVCEKLIAALRDDIELANGQFARVGVSIGLVLYPDNGLEIDSLLAAADAAMYQSKARGKNTWTLATSRPQPNGEVLEWLVFSDTHLLGVAEIDEQHRQLVRLVNRLNRAVNGEDDAGEVAALFARLFEATREHFDTEHRYMQQYGYPAMAVHDHEHQRLLDELSRMAADAAPGNELLILQRLKDWLLDHINGADRQLGHYLVRHGCD